MAQGASSDDVQIELSVSYSGDGGRNETWTSLTQEEVGRDGLSCDVVQREGDDSDAPKILPIDKLVDTDNLTVAVDVQGVSALGAGGWPSEFGALGALGQPLALAALILHTLWLAGALAILLRRVTDKSAAAKEAQAKKGHKAITTKPPAFTRHPALRLIGAPPERRMPFLHSLFVTVLVVSALSAAVWLGWTFSGCRCSTATRRRRPPAERLALAQLASASSPPSSPTARAATRGRARRAPSARRRRRRRRPLRRPRR